MKRLTFRVHDGGMFVKEFDMKTYTIEDEIMHTGNAVRKLAEYEDFEEIFRSKMTDAACELLSDKEEFTRWLDRNKWIAKKCDEYARTEEQGKLLKLPCAVGDTVWDNDFGKPCSYTVTGFAIGNIDNNEENDIDGLKMYYQNWNGSICCSCAVSEIGKTVFLTKEKAEAKLKEMGK